MPPIVRRVLNDLRRGENLDTYATIVVAACLAVLNLIGTVPASKLSGVLLAVLGLLAAGTLATRTKLDALVSQARHLASPSLLDEFPSSYEAMLNGPGDVYLGGVSLTSVIPHYLHSLEARLRAGANVRVLLVEPGSPGAELAERRMAIPADPARRSRQINTTLDHLRWLAQNTHGNLEVRLTPHELPLGWAFAEPSSSKAALYVQYYAFRTKQPDSFKFLLTHADGKWLDAHREQLEAYWSDAQPWAGLTA